MNGALPPSSMEHFLTCSAACLSKIRPTRVEPVKVTLRTKEFSQNSLPEAEASLDVTTCSTPAGIPARIARAPKAKAEKGVNSDGRATKEQPAAKAGAALRVIIALGKFHGVIDAATPIGCLITVIRLSV